MTYEDISTKIANGSYNTKLPYPSITKFKEGHVFDENKSVKWNRETSERLTMDAKKMKDAYNQDNNKLHNEFRKDVIDYIILYTNKPNQANAAFNYAYAEGHSSGYNTVLQIADDLVDILKINN